MGELWKINEITKSFESQMGEKICNILEENMCIGYEENVKAQKPHIKKKL